MSDRTQRAAERMLARLVPGWTPRTVRLAPLVDVRRASGYPERLHEGCIDQDTHRRRIAELFASDRQRDEARAEVERLRALLAEALTGWDAAQDWQISSAAGQRIGEIRREAGLS